MGKGKIREGDPLVRVLTKQMLVSTGLLTKFFNQSAGMSLDLCRQAEGLVVRLVPFRPK